MINPTDIDRIDADIRARYPYPLAATFYRAYYDAPDLATIHEYLLDLFEVTLKYCASIALAQYVKDGGIDPALNKSLQDLQRPSLGHWQGWLREILRLYGKQRRPLLVPELGPIYTQKNTTDLYRATLALRELMTEQMDYRGEGGNPSSVTTQQFFELLGSYRNKLAHGARLNTYTKERVANILMPAMRELFVLLAPLAEYRLVYISEVKLAVGPVRRGPRHYDHVLTYLVGDRPRVSRVPKTLDEDQTVDPKQLYLLAKNEDFQPIVSLHPFLIYQYCDRCSTEQAYVLNMSRENDLTYLSYQCAHQFSVTGLLNDLLMVINPADGESPAPVGSDAGDDSSDSAAFAPLEPMGTPIPVYPYTMAAPPTASPLATTPGMRPCPVCRHLNPTERKFCGGCGTRLQTAAAATPLPIAPPVAAATVTCPRCGQTYPVGRKFCGGCGLALAGVPPQPVVAGPGPGPGYAAPPPSGPAPTVPLGPAGGFVPAFPVTVPPPTFEPIPPPSESPLPPPVEPTLPPPVEPALPPPVEATPEQPRTAPALPPVEATPAADPVPPPPPAQRFGPPGGGKDPRKATPPPDASAPAGGPAGDSKA